MNPMFEHDDIPARFQPCLGLFGGAFKGVFGGTGILSGGGNIPAPLSSSDPVKNTLKPPKLKKPKKPKKPPKRTDKDVEAARQKRLAESQRRGGSQSTVLTSPLGDTSSADVQRKTLLGS